ncbi:L-histidine N(alpha)-methyltransferase [Fulvimarina endophytica]|uniref:L-histidine N(Alpha)-methyltransferase n=2 Tax=Fulvimarina endophytica TaxID=2293836 RepID=A0A371WYW6_9HYPH|nr:L-histidine N(alpha)-methyltransferase [Fulvimarina endophytica]
MADGLGQREAFRADVLEGLSKPQKTLPSRWLYDDFGSQLFERITGLPEYYPTRTETRILSDHAGEIGAFFGEKAVLIEYGAGSGLKTEIVLGALDDPACYVPMDIAGDFLEQSADRLRETFPGLLVRPVTGDFTTDFDLPEDLASEGRGAFFPGSTLGNLGPTQAQAFLRRVRGHVGEGGGFVLGLDRKKDVSRLLAAYDDAQGVTAAFNLNILTRINRELGGTFDLRAFEHEARWNEEAAAVEMHILCTAETRVAVGDETFSFAAGETIHTESSRKYDLGAFAQTARAAGWTLEAIWSDAEELFGVLALRAH